MRLSEIIIVYLAVAAPVGVAYFLRRHLFAPSLTRALASASGAALVWPLVVAADLLEQRRRATSDCAPDTTDGAATEDAEPERRALLGALARIEDLSEEIFGMPDERARLIFSGVKESAERYTGLASALARAEPDASPTVRDIELCRVAGRATGDDLDIAGRCVRRRNAARLAEHHARARRALLHALAELGESCSAGSHPAASVRRATPDFDFSTRRVSESLIELYARAVELCAALDDPRAALGCSRLLDAECARLRRLSPPQRESSRAARHTHGEESCLPTPPPPPQSTPRPRTAGHFRALAANTASRTAPPRPSRRTT